MLKQENCGQSSAADQTYRSTNRMHHMLHRLFCQCSRPRKTGCIRRTMHVLVFAAIYSLTFIVLKIILSITHNPLILLVISDMPKGLVSALILLAIKGIAEKLVRTFDCMIDARWSEGLEDEPLDFVPHSSE